EPGILIEQKGIDAVQWPNRLKVAMAANANWVIPASADERRYAMFDCTPTYTKGHASDAERLPYLNTPHAENADRGLSAMLYDMQHLDLKGWHPRQVYETEALRAQKEESLTPLDQWFVEILQDGKLPGVFRANGAKRNVTTAALLYEDAKAASPALL